MQVRFLLLLLPLFILATAAAQPELTVPGYRQYTLRDGLSQMQVTCMYQDSRGYIWIGTKAGLNRFNGDKITSYTTGNHPQLADDYIYTVKEDGRGRIWGSTATGIYCIDGDAVTYYSKPGWADIKIAPDADGRIWYLATEASLKALHFGYLQDGKFYVKDDRLPHHEYTVSTGLMIAQPGNELLISLGKMLYKFSGEKAAVLYQNPVLIEFIPENQGKCIFIDSDDSRNFNLLSFTNGKVEVTAQVKKGRYLAKPSLAAPVYYIRNLNNPAQIALMQDTILYDFAEGLQVNKFLYDRDGYLWVGSEVGLYQLFGHGFTTYKKEYLPQVWAVTEDKNGSIWFSSFMFGLSKLQNGQLRKFPELAKKDIAYFYFHPSVDKRGRMYFPNSYGMLTVDGGNFRQYADSYYITTFYDSERDLLWAGSKKQAFVFNANGQKIRIIGENDGLNVGNNVLCIHKDLAGSYWFGGGRGVARYQWETGSLKHYGPSNANLTVVSICSDYKGRCWFGSDKGLFWYNAATDKLEQLKCSELDGAVNLVTVVGSKWLIVSQPYGIYLLDLQEYYRTGEVKLNLFNEKNGFMGVEPGQDGAFTDSKGKIWMTTSTEVVCLDPEKLKIGNNSLFAGFAKFNGRRLPFTAENIELEPNQSSAVVTFEAVCFNRPNPVEYSWKLAQDTAWSEWQTEDYAVISGLKDGLSELMVRARVKGLPLPEAAQASMGIQVRMAFYRQPWFFPALFSFISFIGICALAIALLRMKKASREARMFQVQAIQSQMNPHFIFNVLASLQSMILKSNISKANDYLVKLADLIRGFLEASAGTGVLKSPQSDEGQVSIASELLLLKEFVEFQQVINPGRFDFAIQMAGNIDPEKELLPPMLLQPFIENAIRHGILPSPKKGMLQLSFQKTGGYLTIEISDNGVGLEKSRQMLQNSPMRYISRGSELTMNRVKLLNQLGFKIEIHTESTHEGTRVTLKIGR